MGAVIALARTLAETVRARANFTGSPASPRSPGTSADCPMPPDSAESIGMPRAPPLSVAGEARIFFFRGRHGESRYRSSPSRDCGQSKER